MAEANVLSGAQFAVDPFSIEREIHDLWRGAGSGGNGRKTAEGEKEIVSHVCLSNIIFYLPTPQCYERARAILPDLGRRFPSRFILLTHGEAGASGAILSAWVGAICHLVGAGQRPVCCEEITLQAPPGSLDLFPGAVAPLLVPDVPVALFLLGPGGLPLLWLLRDLIEKAVFDSRELGLGQLQRPLALIERGGEAQGDDLAWRDIIGWRSRLCDIFDDPLVRPLLSRLDRIDVEYRATEKGDPLAGAARAALLAGWISSAIGARPLKERGPSPLVRLFERTAEGGAEHRGGRGRITVALHPVEPSNGKGAEAPGSLISVRLSSGDGREAPALHLSSTASPDILRVEYHTDEACGLPQRVPLRRESDAELIGYAIERETHQGILRKALEAAVLFAEPSGR